MSAIKASDKFALSIPEFCEVVGIGRSRAYEEIKAGRLQIVKAGRRTLVPVTAIRDWLSALGVPPRESARA